MKIAAFALACLLFTAGSSMAQEEARSLGLYGIGGELGLANPEIIDGTVGFGVQADLGDIQPNIAIVAGIKYWSVNTGNSQDGSTDISEISLNGDAYYHFPVKSNFRPFAGAGVAFTNTSVGAGGAFGDGTGVGLNLFGGARYPASASIDVYSEARFKLGSSSLDTFTIKVGAMYLLNR